jgi:hypothetical protein
MSHRKLPIGRSLRLLISYAYVEISFETSLPRAVLISDYSEEMQSAAQLSGRPLGPIALLPKRPIQLL